MSDDPCLRTMQFFLALIPLCTLSFLVIYYAVKNNGEAAAASALGLFFFALCVIGAFSN